MVEVTQVFLLCTLGNGSSVIQRFEGSGAIEICDGITFDFYTGLPHIMPQCFHPAIITWEMLHYPGVSLSE